jgi:hypothetical protein
MPESSAFRRLAAVLVRPRTWLVPYVALWVLVGLLPINQTDLDIFFWPSATFAVHGRPLMVYSPAGQSLYPNANGPLALVPLTAVGLVADRLGWLYSVPNRRVLALGFFSLFLILMSREGMAAIDRVRHRPVTGMPRLLGYCALLLAPVIWQAVSGYGHIEQPIEVWLLLLVTRWIGQGWMMRAGLALGLAALSRTAAGLMAAPLALAVLRRGPGRLAAFFAATVVTGVAGLLPFYLADAPDLTHSLFTYRGRLPVGAGSVWSVLTDAGAIAFVQHWDILFVAAAVLVANLWLATRPGGFTDERLLGGMALTAACFILFVKTVWPYYFFEVYVLTTVWVAARWRRADGVVSLVMPSLALCVFGMVAEIGSAPGLEHRLVAVEGGAMFVMLGLLSCWLAWWGRRTAAGPAWGGQGPSR